MKIFIDFDDVLFNTRDFSAYLKEFFAKAGISQELFQQYYYDPVDQANGNVKLFNPEGLLARLEKYEKIKVDSIQADFEAQLQDLRRFVFADVQAFLVAMGKENLYVVSFGLPSFQQRKFIGSGLSELVESCVVTENLKAQAVAQLIEEVPIKPTEKIIFIDDRIEQLEDVKKKHPAILTIFLCRKEGRYCDQKNEFCDWEAHDLREVEKIISNTKSK